MVAPDCTTVKLNGTVEELGCTVGVLDPLGVGLAHIVAVVEGDQTTPFSPS